jgi:hypothetical protein
MNKDAFCCSEWTCTKKHILAIIGDHEEKWQTWYSMWFEIPNIVLSILQFELRLFLMFHVNFFIIITLVGLWICLLGINKHICCKE